MEHLVKLQQNMHTTILHIHIWFKLRVGGNDICGNGGSRSSSNVSHGFVRKIKSITGTTLSKEDGKGQTYVAFVYWVKSLWTIFLYVALLV